MKYKRTISLLLVAVLVLGVLSGCNSNSLEQANPTKDTSQNQTQETPTTEETSERINELDISDLWKQELLHATQLGMPMGKVQQDSISGKEMMELLDWFVDYAAPEKADTWQEQFPALRKSAATISRFDAMTALFLAAEYVGGVYAGHNYGIMEMSAGINHSWDVDYLSWELFGGFDAHGQYNCGVFGDGYLDGASYYYNLGRASYFSGEYPFPLDTVTNSFTFDAPPTYAEAMLAIVRLISSTDSTLFVAEPSQVEIEYLNMADARREAIQTADTDIEEKITGTVYYVSEHGSDHNNGRSPETAWATPQHALSQKLRSGDAVLLERGGSWIIDPSNEWGLTSSALIVPNGVTLGAYGTGEKPILRGNVESANSADFWELHSEQNGAKIWKAARSVFYCPIIVFNEGESYASPVLPGMDGSGQYLSDDGSAFDVASGLYRDLQFCCLLDLTQDGVGVNVENAAATGELYLRCDSGNPAEVYDSIAVPQTACGLTLRTDAAITDISLRYFTCNGAVMDGYDGFHSQSVSNCEVGWCGGLLKGYSENNAGVFEPEAAGGALQVSSTGVSVTDSYIHHCGPFALIVAIHNNAENPSSCILHFEDICIANNLIEYCGSGIHMGDYADMDLPGTKGYITNLAFENNLVMNSGMGWVRELVWRESGGSSASLSAFETNDSAIDNDGIYIRNNVFYKSGFSLFSLSDYHLDRTTRVNALPVFSGNTYVQTANKPILQKNRSTEVYYPSEEAMREILGDETGSLVIIGE